MKSGDQSIGWSTEIDFEYSDTKYTMGPAAYSSLDFPKVEPNMDAVACCCIVVLPIK